MNATAEDGAFVAVDDTSGAFVGMWGVLPHTHAPATVWIVGVWVAPEARGTDVATRLNDACVDFARTTNAKEPGLHVTSFNQRARRFYERTGWVPVVAAEPEENDTADDLLQLCYRAFRDA